MKKVLYLSYDGLTDSLGQSQVLPYLIGLSKKGVDYHVISFEKPKQYNLLKNQIQIICDEHGITWHPQFYTKKPPVLSTLRDMGEMRRQAKRLHKINQFNIVHCRSYIPGIIGMYLKKHNRIKFLFDMRGFWADERVEGNIWNIKKPVYKFIYNFFKKKESQLFKNADHIISLTHKGKKVILNNKKWSTDNEKVTVIPCCVDMELFDPTTIRLVAQENLRHALKISENDLVLGYVGSIGTWYMLDEMLDFFKVQYEKNNRLKFLFITQEASENIFNIAKNKSIPKKAILIASTSHKYVPLHISLFDFSLFFIRPTYSKQASSPTKQAELMAMGIPVICNSGVGDTDEIIERHQSGIVIKELNRKNYEIINLSAFKSNAEDLRKGATEVFSLKNGVALYWECYCKVLN